MSRKILSALLALALTAATVSGCSKKPNDPPSANDGYYAYELSEYITLADASKEITRAKLDEEMLVEYKSLSETPIIYGGTAEGAQPADGITVAKGDTANIDYTGKKDGVAFQGGTDTGFDLVIGSNKFIAGFEDGLIGVAVGATVDLNLKFPDNYHSADLAGQSVVFTVKVNYISRPTYPEYNEENVKKYTGYTIAEFEKQMAGIIIFDRIYTQTKVIKYPEKELATITEKYLKDYKDAATSYGISLETYLSYMGATLAELNQYADRMAKQYVKRDMIAYSIVNSTPSLKLTEEDYEKELKAYWETSVKNGFKGTLDDFRDEVDRADVESGIYVQRVITHLGNQAQIV